MTTDIPQPQVDSRHYISRRYNHKVRWMNFWHQIDEISRFSPKNILEIGKGSGLVSDHLKKMGYKVTTADIDESVNPDARASVTKLPFDKDAFDVVLCAEVLEHIPYKDVSVAISEIHKVVRKGAVVSLPYAGSRFFFSLKIPKIPIVELFIPIPYFWKRHRQTREHYWEVGKKGFSVQKIKKLFEGYGFKIRKTKIFHNDFNHIFFVIEK